MLKFRRIIIWGLEYPTHSHHFIHRGFYSTLKKINRETIWLSDELISNEYIRRGDLIICAGIAIKNLKLNDGNYYCFHNVDGDFKNSLNRHNFIDLQVMTHKIYKSKNEMQKMKGCSYYSVEHKTLYQSWGTPLIENEFLCYTNYESTNTEFFVGSVWNNELNQGNIDVIKEYKNILEILKTKFVQVKGVSEYLSKYFIRNSRFGAAIVGDWQRTEGYTPCRLFKAISLGKIGIINSCNTKIHYPWVIANESIIELLEGYLSLSKKEKINLLKEQQLLLAEETYKVKIQNIENSFQI